MVLEFQYFLKSKKVRKITPDKDLAFSLRKDAEKRFMDSLLMEPKYKLENSYEAVRELIDSLMALHGYKTYSHEASISYLAKFKEFNDFEIEQLDIIRQKRNNSKYYGEEIEKEESEKTIFLLKPIFEKLLKILKEKI